MTSTQRPSRFALILAFGLLYFFWGSTYLGIDLAIQSVPPALMCGIRFTIAGLLMLGYCAIVGRPLFYSWPQLGLMCLVGVLLLMGGNLTLSYAELQVPTGVAALIIAVTPLWFMVLDALLLGHHSIAARGKIGLGLGVVGLAVLLWPDLMATGPLGRPQLVMSFALVAGSFTWALGSVISKRWKSPKVDPFSAMGWQMLAAGIANFLFSLVTRDFDRVVWNARGIGAMAYLVVCGSLIGYTAYIWLLGNVPTSKLSTYAYVNPVVAVFLGWLILHERVDKYVLAGSAIVVASVALVTSATVDTKRVSEEMALAETVGD